MMSWRALKRNARLILFVAIVAVMLVVDRLTKVWAADVLQHGVTGYDFGPVSFTLVHNRGAAFGMAQGGTIVFVALAVVIVAAILAWLVFGKEHAKAEVVGLSLVAAGGIGNLIDRLTTVYVVDFIQFDFIDFPVFNVADICVTCGVVLFIVALFFSMVHEDAPDDKGGQDA